MLNPFMHHWHDIDVLLFMNHASNPISLFAVAAGKLRAKPNVQPHFIQL